MLAARTATTGLIDDAVATALGALLGRTHLRPPMTAATGASSLGSVDGRGAHVCGSLSVSPIAPTKCCRRSMSARCRWSLWSVGQFRARSSSACVLLCIFAGAKVRFCRRRSWVAAQGSSDIVLASATRCSATFTRAGLGSTRYRYDDSDSGSDRPRFCMRIERTSTTSLRLCRTRKCLRRVLDAMHCSRGRKEGAVGRVRSKFQ